nr:oxygen-independent coproporphyrinogen iii oxidase [uncultured bacterium]
MTSGANDTYKGFEQGPIRPPSEAYSLLVRVTRNCPWNRCSFCPVYKGTKFSLRPVDHVKRDIDAVYRHVERLRQLTGERGRIGQDQIDKLAENVERQESLAFAAALNWLFGGGLKSVFLQDANSLVIKPHDLVEILTHLRKRFPSVERITSYARSHTVARRKDDDLRAIRDSGLNRLHIGLESGSDEVLKAVSKGCTKQMHVEAGLKARRAGFEVSEYFMPGLGGRALSYAHALESAEALSRINPDFIRLRALAIPNGAPLAEDYRDGRFEKCTDVMVAGELVTFIENLDGISSVVTSDHILNLFSDLEGTLPRDKQAMIAIPRAFLEMPPERQRLYQVGRSLGILSCTGDLEDPFKRALAEESCRRLRVTPQNVDEITDEIVKRYI